VRREHRLRDSRQLRADRGRQRPARRHAHRERRHDAQPDAPAASRRYARRAARGRERRGEREPRVRDPRGGRHRRSSVAGGRGRREDERPGRRTRSRGDRARGRALPEVASGLRLAADVDAVIRGVVFDLDGVVADTERLQWAAYRHVLAAFGIDVGIDEYRREWIATGFGPEYACRTYRLPITPDELRARKAPVYQAMLRDGVSACAGAGEAL